MGKEKERNKKEEEDKTASYRAFPQAPLRFSAGTPAFCGTRGTNRPHRPWRTECMPACVYRLFWADEE